MRHFPQFMRKEPEPLVFAGGAALGAGLIALASKLCHGAGDGAVEASVQHPEIIGADRRPGFDGPLGDGLTHVAVVVHDLSDGEALPLEIVPVQDGAASDSLAPRTSHHET